MKQEKDQIRYTLEVSDKYDKEFINLILQIEKKYSCLTKQDKLKIESWIKILCIPTINLHWKKNRNLHAILMLNMIQQKRLEEPYNKFAESVGQKLPFISESIVKSKLSKSFSNIHFDEIEINEFFESLFHKFIQKNDKLKDNKILLKNKIKQFSNNTLLYSKVKKENSIDLYSYYSDVENLKQTINNLKLQNKNKEEIILKLNQEKKKLDIRLHELENIIQIFVQNRHNQEIKNSALKLISDNK